MNSIEEPTEGKRKFTTSCRTVEVDKSASIFLKVEPIPTCFQPNTQFSFDIYRMRNDRGFCIFQNRPRTNHKGNTKTKHDVIGKLVDHMVLFKGSRQVWISWLHVQCSLFVQAVRRVANSCSLGLGREVAQAKSMTLCANGNTRDSIYWSGVMENLSQERVNLSQDRKGYTGFTDVSNIYKRCALTFNLSSLSLSRVFFPPVKQSTSFLHWKTLGKHYKQFYQIYQRKPNIYARGRAIVGLTSLALMQACVSSMGRNIYIYIEKAIEPKHFTLSCNFPNGSPSLSFQLLSVVIFRRRLQPAAGNGSRASLEICTRGETEKL